MINRRYLSASSTTKTNTKNERNSPNSNPDKRPTSSYTTPADLTWTGPRRALVAKNTVCEAVGDPPVAVVELFERDIVTLATSATSASSDRCARSAGIALARGLRGRNANSLLLRASRLWFARAPFPVRSCSDSVAIRPDCGTFVNRYAVTGEPSTAQDSGPQQNR